MHIHIIILGYKKIWLILYFIFEFQNFEKLKLILKPNFISIKFIIKNYYKYLIKQYKNTIFQILFQIKEIVI